MTSPLPPSHDPAGAPGHGARVYAGFFGQEWDRPDGTTVTLESDGVILEFTVNGRPVAARFSSPESAIELARFLVTAAGEVQSKQVGDDGKTLSVTERLKAFSDAWKGQS